MSHRIVFGTLFLLATIAAGECFAKGLLLGMDGVGWEANNATGPLLYREVPEAQLVSVRAKISNQTAGLWSQAGVIARIPNAGAGENWQISWSFRAPAAGPFQHQSNQSLNGAEQEFNDGGLRREELNYVRLDNMGAGVFQAYRGSGPDDDNITWTPQMAGGMPQPQTNANLVGQTLQVGVAAGAIGALAGSAVIFDWVEIQTTSETVRDDFTYAPTHDFIGGVPAGSIWTGTVNAGVGGMATVAGADVGLCTTCTWNTDGSGDFNGPYNWAPFIAGTPNGNNIAAVFGPALTGTSATVYTNKNVTLKQIDFDNANTYVLAGAGSITLEADTGDALLNVLQGNHEIQADLVLADNVTATAAAGSSLNVNTPVYLNGHTFTVSPGSTVNLNDGTVLSGTPGAGAGQLVNGGSLSGLASLDGDLVQTAGGSLAIDVGGAPVQVSGSAALSGVLDVSLVDGFHPAVGSSYTVLAADSVADLGLSLGGSDAELFRLQVGGDSVSLVAVGIPEPSTLALIAFGLTAGAVVRVRRRALACDSGGQTLSHRTQRLLVVALVMLLGMLAQRAYAQHPVPPGMLLETRHDDFGNDAMPLTQTFDYTTGAMPHGIWTNIHNPTNGGDGSTPGCGPTAACFVADGTDFTSVAHPGKLFVEDLNLHQSTDLSLGVGWEGGRNNAPLLYTEFPAQNDFDAVVKIDAQTAGQWSWAGILARVAGPPVGLGGGDGGLDPAENFVSVGRFATDAANPANSTILRKNIVNGAQVADGQFGAVAGGTLPLWVRLTKIGGQFSTARSLDGTTWESFAAAAGANPTADVFNTALNTAGNTLQVGIGYMNFGGLSGSAEFDSFDINIYGPGTVTTATWTGNAFASVGGSGDWNDNTNWICNVPGCIPNHNTVAVTLGPTANVTGQTTVLNNQGVMVKSLIFDGTNKYALAGAGSVSMTADTGPAAINVNAGSHEIQLDLALNSATTLTAAAGTKLDVNNQLDFMAAGRALTVTGGGRVNINSQIDLPISGAVTVSGGSTVGGNGRINGNLNNNQASGGIVAPGTSAGTLMVDGSYQQNAASTLAIEIGGTAAGAFDKLAVAGLAILGNGTLSVSLIDGFVPVSTDSFQILTATTSLATNTRFGNTPGNILTFPGGSFTVTYTYGANGNVTLSNFTSAGLAGDYNGDGKVDAADYVMWRKDPAAFGGDPAGYNTWRANFGKTSGSGSSLADATAVPEPGSVALLTMLAMLGLGIVRRR